MKVWRSFSRYVSVVAVAVVILTAAEAFHVKRALSVQERFHNRLLANTMTSLLRRASQANDDLLSQTIIAALQKTPGVTRVAWKPPDHLRVTLSTHVRNAIYTQHFLAHFIGLVLLAGGLLVFSFAQLSATEKNGNLIDELNVLLREEKHQRSLAERQSLDVRDERQAIVRRVVAYVARPVVVLDAQQRVAAASPAVLERLQMPENDILGKSWHELPILKDLGVVISDTFDHASRQESNLKSTPWVAISVE